MRRKGAEDIRSLAGQFSEDPTSWPLLARGQGRGLNSSLLCTLNKVSFHGSESSLPSPMEGEAGLCILYAPSTPPHNILLALSVLLSHQLYVSSLFGFWNHKQSTALIFASCHDSSYSVRVLSLWMFKRRGCVFARITNCGCAFWQYWGL